MSTDALAVCRESIATHSKSFSLASKLLGEGARDEAAAVYAFCRRADDAVDLEQTRPLHSVVAELRAELDLLYGGAAQSDPALAAFQEVVQRRRIPRHYPDELLAGMAMDASATRYPDLPALLVYCYRVAGTVGLMMSHVLGVRAAAALKHAAHLGMAMQLTNICRDVREDWDRGRLYLPGDALARAGAPALETRLGAPLTTDDTAPLARVIRELLLHADLLYASGEAGIPFLAPRAGLAIRSAALIYADIGRVLSAHDADVFAPRAVVSTQRKLSLALLAALRTMFAVRDPGGRVEISQIVGFHDVIPV